MRSMTGFGCGDAELDGNKLTCELRALNHRFLDVRVRMPEELASLAFFVEQLARERLSRGRFDIGVRLEDGGSAARFSPARARAVYQSLLQLRDELAPECVAFAGAHLVQTGERERERLHQGLLQAVGAGARAIDQQLRQGSQRSHRHFGARRQLVAQLKQALVNGARTRRRKTG